MTIAFLDTVGLLAVWNKADQWHVAADAAFQELISQRVKLVTTDLILAECGNAAARRPYRMDVCDLRRSLLLRNDLIEPLASEWENAWEAYERGDAAQAGIVDQVSFAVMRRLDIQAAFTNDRHFEAAGFTVLF